MKADPCQSTYPRSSGNSKKRKKTNFQLDVQQTEIRPSGRNDKTTYWFKIDGVQIIGVLLAFSIASLTISKISAMFVMNQRESIGETEF